MVGFNMSLRYFVKFESLFKLSHLILDFFLLLESFHLTCYSLIHNFIFVFIMCSSKMETGELAHTSMSKDKDVTHVREGGTNFNDELQPTINPS